MSSGSRDSTELVCAPLQVGKDRSLRVKVLEVLPLEGLLDELGEKKVEGACDSPSSDKENTSREQLKVELQPEEESRRSHSCECRAQTTCNAGIGLFMIYS